ncbi:glycosyltransferase family 2 protein [Winogradskyella litorisediminis]|uniref:Glycosyltransferase family 2 protein n=1 Tax=Winogradskyella litorisediminis TaxID=1156618 RepID=A0ABW3N8Q0_9FLAO
MPPFFSVIIPLYNKEKYISETLESVLNQSFEDFEIIVVNDGSTDNSEAEVLKFKDKRIKLIKQKNQGLSHTRNNAIKFSEGKYMAFIDADDTWKPNHLKQLNQLITDFPDNGLYTTRYTLKKTESIYHKAVYNGLPENFRGVVPDFFKHSLQHCVAWVGAMCIPKYVFDNVGYFDPEIYSEQDIDLYIRINLKYKTVLDTTKITSIYNRTMDDNMSQFSTKTAIPKFLNSYKSEEKDNKYLNRYMDSNRFSTVVFFKLSGNKDLERELKKDIDYTNLNWIQTLILKLPNPLVKLLFTIKDELKLNPFFVFKTR